MSEKYTPPTDGDPVEMSQVTLGPRYGPEDLYRDTGIKLGSAMSFEKDGVIYTDAVESVHYSGGSPAISREVSRWKWLPLRLTPPRWRRTLLIRDAEPASVTVEIGDKHDVPAAFARVLKECDDALGRLENP